VSLFPSLYPLLFFPAQGKILAWAGRKKIPGQRRENIRVFVGNGSVIKKEYDLTIIVGKYR